MDRAGAEWQRGAPENARALSDDDLEAAAAEIQHAAAAAAVAQAAGSAPIGERRLLCARHQVERHTRLRPHPLDQCSAVGRRAHALCRNAEHSAGAQLPRALGLRTHRKDATGHALLADVPQCRDVRPQPHHFLPVVQYF